MWDSPDFLSETWAANYAKRALSEFGEFEIDEDSFIFSKGDGFLTHELSFRLTRIDAEVRLEAKDLVIEVEDVSRVSDPAELLSLCIRWSGHKPAASFLALKAQLPIPEDMPYPLQRFVTPVEGIEVVGLAMVSKPFETAFVRTEINIWPGDESSLRIETVLVPRQAPSRKDFEMLQEEFEMSLTRLGLNKK